MDRMEPVQRSACSEASQAMALAAVSGAAMPSEPHVGLHESEVHVLGEGDAIGHAGVHATRRDRVDADVWS